MRCIHVEQVMQFIFLRRIAICIWKNLILEMLRPLDALSLVEISMNVISLTSEVVLLLGNKLCANFSKIPRY